MSNVEDNDGEDSIKIYDGSRLYNFFLFTLTAADILILGKDFYEPAFREQFDSDEAFEAKHALQSRLNSLTDSIILGNSGDSPNRFSTFSWLSSKNVLDLLSLIDMLSKNLLNAPDDAYSRSLIREVGRVSGAGDNWERPFFIEAQFVFDEVKEAFKDHPEIIEAITNVKGQ